MASLGRIESMIVECYMNCSINTPTYVDFRYIIIDLSIAGVARNSAQYCMSDKSNKTRPRINAINTVFILRNIE